MKKSQKTLAISLCSVLALFAGCTHLNYPIVISNPAAGVLNQYQQGKKLSDIPYANAAGYVLYSIADYQAIYAFCLSRKESSPSYFQKITMCSTNIETAGIDCLPYSCREAPGGKVGEVCSVLGASSFVPWAQTDKMVGLSFHDQETEFQVCRIEIQ